MSVDGKYNNINPEKRIVCLDILRMIAVIMIFLFHSKIHMNIDFGYLDPLIVTGAVFMDLFFMISGFVTSLTTWESKLYIIQNYRTFLLRRMTALYPSYLIVSILFTVTLAWNTKSFITLLPMDLMLLQSTVDGSFASIHHGGTWFISCLFVCYLLTPSFVGLVKQMERKHMKLLIAVLYFIGAYIPFATYIMGYSTVYSNVVYRALQYFIGVVLCGLYMEKRVESKNTSGSLVLPVFALIVLVTGINVTYGYFGSDYPRYDFVCIPIFATWIHCLSLRNNNKKLMAIVTSKVFVYYNTIAYEIFLAQFFCFKIVNSLFLGGGGIRV